MDIDDLQIPSNIQTGEFNCGKDYKAICDDAAIQLNHIDGLCYERILEVGCGAGRLPMGLISNKMNFKEYTGIDVNKNSILWCQNNIESIDSRCKFEHINMNNERYNSIEDKENNLLIESDVFNKKYDFIYLYSVFSHLKPSDIKWYLNKFFNCLDNNGTIYTTLFMVENLDKDYIENPKNIFSKLPNPSGPLHVCCYKKSYFEKMLKNVGFLIKECSLRFQDDNDGQHLYLLKKVCE